MHGSMGSTKAIVISATVFVVCLILGLVASAPAALFVAIGALAISVVQVIGFRKERMEYGDSLGQTMMETKMIAAEKKRQLKEIRKEKAIRKQMQKNAQLDAMLEAESAEDEIDDGIDQPQPTHKSGSVKRARRKPNVEVQEESEEEMKDSIEESEEKSEEEVKGSGEESEEEVKNNRKPKKIRKKLETMTQEEFEEDDSDYKPPVLETSATFDGNEEETEFDEEDEDCESEEQECEAPKKKINVGLKKRKKIKERVEEQDFGRFDSSGKKKRKQVSAEGEQSEISLDDNALVLGQRSENKSNAGVVTTESVGKFDINGIPKLNEGDLDEPVNEDFNVEYIEKKPDSAQAGDPAAKSDFGRKVKELKGASAIPNLAKECAEKGDAVSEKNTDTNKQADKSSGMVLGELRGISMIPTLAKEKNQDPTKENLISRSVAFIGSDKENNDPEKENQ